jgi:NAD(P)-dependent dehydrogenase (short-subunit alcohol dehydrogenase family)
MVLANLSSGSSFDMQVAQGKMTMREMWNKTWNVNTTGTYILTHTFVPLLLKSSDPRLLFITSGLSTLTENDNTTIGANKSPEKGWPKQGFSMNVAAYRSSKTGMNMMMREWVRILKEDGVKIFGISPGFLATGLGGNREVLKKMGALDPTIGANVVKEVVEGVRDQGVGKVIRRTDIQPW